MRKEVNARQKASGNRTALSILLNPRERALAEALRASRGARSVGALVRELLLEEEERVEKAGGKRLREMLK